ncbi:MAG: FadR family transcriptional regulator [Burkholderiales bacterium]|nr:FadR family transcriptional regulator [Burkholderiales bacterium]
MELRAQRDVRGAAAAAPAFRRLGRRKAYEEVADRIRGRIFGARLKSGERLPTERDLAAQFGVSRVVVREAIRALELGGLVTVRKGPKGGILVAEEYHQPITQSFGNLLARGAAGLADLFEVRRLIEPYAAERVARAGTASQLAALATLVEKADAEHCWGGVARPFNIEFHRQLIRMAGNPVLAAVGETVLQMMTERLPPVTSRTASAAALGMHKALLGALRAGDAATAREIMEKDIAAVGRRLARLTAKPKTTGRKE